MHKQREEGYDANQDTLPTGKTQQSVKVNKNFNIHQNFSTPTFNSLKIIFNVFHFY